MSAISATRRVAPVRELGRDHRTLLQQLLTGLPFQKISTSGSLASREIRIVPEGKDGVAGDDDVAAGYITYHSKSKDSQVRIFFSDIWEIRNDVTAARVREAKAAKLSGGSIISIVSESGVSLALLDGKGDSIERLYTIVCYLSTRSRSVGNRLRRLKHLWEVADENRDGTLSRKEADKMLSHINIEPKAAAKIVDRYFVSGKGISFVEMCSLISELLRHPKAVELYGKFCVSGQQMTSEGFGTFLQQEQLMTPEEAGAVTRARAGPGGTISLDSFVTYLFGESNSWIDFRATSMANMETMGTYPLTHYWINTSHNTYLTGDQLQSDSDPDMYSRALLAGCRCVELDCWDGPTGPIIYHGYTRTSKISFASVIRAIADNAFIASPYPVIISLENHTSLGQSAAMATILKDTLGPRLLLPKHEAEWKEFSPNRLKFRFLIKWKGSAEGDDDVKELDGAPAEVLNEATKDKPSQHHSGELSALVTVPALKSKDWGVTANPHHVESFSENKMEQFYTNNRDIYTAMNTKMLSRVYPKGSRIDSSNYDPVLPWALGAQLVALNYQTWDHPMHINRGRFLVNGGSGYVLKPPHLRGKASPSSPKSCTLSVHVLGASQLPKEGNKRKGEVIDPYVRVELWEGFGKQVHRTPHVDNNGFNPCFDSVFTLEVWDPSVAMLHIVVVDDEVARDDTIAQAAIPVSALREGIRNIPLYLSNNGKPLDVSSVLCKFKLTFKDVTSV